QAGGAETLGGRGKAGQVVTRGLPELRQRETQHTRESSAARCEICTGG
ncbi:MAG: hypothetical protein QOE41_414, partial [Mycobacterium sp.]|nr:hypothetical protein [Mycobacterium sp.]